MWVNPDVGRLKFSPVGQTDNDRLGTIDYVEIGEDHAATVNDETRGCVILPSLEWMFLFGMTSRLDRDKNRHTIEARHVISSAPMRALAHGIRPRLSDKAIQAAGALSSRLPLLPPNA